MSFPESVYDAESALNVQAAAADTPTAPRSLHAPYGPGTSSTRGNHHRHAEYRPRKRRATWLGSSVITSSCAAATAARQAVRPPPDRSGPDQLAQSSLTFDESWLVSDMADLVLDFHSIDIKGHPELDPARPVAHQSRGVPVASCS